MYLSVIFIRFMFLANKSLSVSAAGERLSSVILLQSIYSILLVGVTSGCSGRGGRVSDS